MPASSATAPSFGGAGERCVIPANAAQEGKGAAMHITEEPPDLRARIGGEAVLASVIDDFYLRVTGDALVAPVFSRVDLPALRQHQRQFLSTVLDAAPEPTGAYLRAAHRDLQITPRQFAVVAGHLRFALQDAQVPAPVIDELMQTVERYADDIIGR
jgi:hemoglobin